MSLKVLVVDDSPAVRLVLRRALLRVGIQGTHIFETEDAQKALRIFQRYHPEVVFMDLTLKPRVSHSAAAEGDDPTPPIIPDSFEAGEVLAKQMLYRDPAIKLILCTGANRDSDAVREVVKYGAAQLLEKPITLEKVQRVFQYLAAEGLTVSSSGSFRGESEPITGIDAEAHATDPHES